MSEKQFINKLKKTHHIIIYGAGMVGELVYQRLSFYGLADKVLCFAITNHPIQASYLGVPLRGIDEMVMYNKTAIVIVATLPKLHDEMKMLLLKHSFQNIIFTKSALYQSLAGNYIREFLKNKKEDDKPVDVVLMASDNNSSSGAFLCLADLGHELNHHGIRCRVILPEYGDGEKVLIERGVDYTYIPSEHWCICKDDNRVVKLWRLRKNHKAVQELQDYFIRHHVKLVHNNTTYTYAGAIAASREKLPVVWHLRENIEDQGYNFMHEDHALKWMNHSNQIIAISDYMAHCIKGINHHIVKIIYDGVDSKKYYCKKNILENDRQIIITMIGAVIEHKRQEELLRAAIILKSDLMIDFKIRFAGKEEGGYIKRLLGIVEQYQLQNFVSFLGKQDNVEELYRESDIAVICSKAEPFGRVTIEAQLSGCLVIGADSGATKELIRDNETGLLYHAGNAEDLAAHIIWAAEHPQEAGKIAKAGQEHARVTYSKENNANEVMQVYKEILRNGR